jgi:hypothetical protein
MGAMSGYWTWMMSVYPLIKGIIGELAFWMGAALTIYAFLTTVKKIWKIYLDQKPK